MEVLQIIRLQNELYDLSELTHKLDGVHAKIEVLAIIHLLKDPRVEHHVLLANSQMQDRQVDQIVQMVQFQTILHQIEMNDLQELTHWEVGHLAKVEVLDITQVLMRVVVLDDQAEHFVIPVDEVRDQLDRQELIQVQGLHLELIDKQTAILA